MRIKILSYLDSSSDDGGYTQYKVEIPKESEEQDMRRCMITSIDNVTQVSITFRKKKTGNKKMGINVKHKTKKEKGTAYVCLDTHTQE